MVPQIIENVGHLSDLISTIFFGIILKSDIFIFYTAEQNIIFV